MMDMMHMVFLAVGYVTLLYVIAHCTFQRDTGQNINVYKIAFLVPGFIAFFALAQGGGHMIDADTNRITVYEYVSGDVIERFVIQAPDPTVWSLWHLALGLVLMLYIIGSTLTLLFMHRRK